MAGTLDPGVGASLAVPADDGAVAGPAVDGLLVTAQGQGGDGLVVASDYGLYLGGRVQVQVVYKAGERDGHEVGARPETAHLLVLHPLPHLEGGEAAHVGHVPHLTSLVPGGREQFLAGAVPGQAVHTPGVAS